MKRHLKNIARIAPDLKGWTTKRRILVIESDDWGAIRMPNKRALQSIPSKYNKYYDSPYYKYDTIASREDFTFLLDAISTFKDKNGNPPLLTANCIMANPDFERIKQDGFNQYSYQKFTETLSSYTNNVFELWKEGISEGLFHPQLHGREHVDVSRWMNELKTGNPIYLDAFQRGTYAVDAHLNSSKRNLTAALDFKNMEDERSKANALTDGCEIFKSTFGFQSSSFIAPSYTWGNLVESKLKSNGVKYFQGIRTQKKPQYNSENIDFKKHFLGERNKYHQHYLVRNVFFEPSLMQNINVLDDALARIRWSFCFNRPAILSTHRLNFIGTLDSDNRDNNLKLLKQLLRTILIKWPDVEFMSSDKLGDFFTNNLYEKKE